MLHIADGVTKLNIPFDLYVGHKYSVTMLDIICVAILAIPDGVTMLDFHGLTMLVVSDSVTMLNSTSFNMMVIPNG